MKKEEIKTKLNDALSRLGMEANEWLDLISGFRQKLEFIFDTQNYNKLFKALFSSNELNEFNSYVFEVLFAYDFESKCQPLLYEVKQLSDNNSSIDFCYEFNGKNQIYFELRLIKQRAWITNSIDLQLKNRSSYKIELNGNDQRNETFRLQNLILSKCQKDDGTPIKFSKLSGGKFNFIVINLSELHFGHILKEDCMFALYGDYNLPLGCRLGIFGMWQNLPNNATNEEKKYHLKFKHFRETIHGTVFVRHVKRSGFLGGMYIDRELEYYSILNNNLLQEKESNLIIERLSSFLKEWQESGYHRRDGKT